MALPWIVDSSKVDLSVLDPRDTSVAPGDKKATAKATQKLYAHLADLQERLRAEARQALLVVLQAMDGGGKDSTIKRVFSSVDPQGLQVTAFKVPSEEELSHDFLWRVHKALPPLGHIGIFNRSHYEDVVVTRARELVKPKVIKERITSIVDFEAHVNRSQTRIVKLFLHISKDEQLKRLQARIEDPTKQWKYNPHDIEDRDRWPAFESAYEDAIAKTSTKQAPWFVIPADHKWFRDWAVATVLVHTLETMDPQFPVTITSKMPPCGHRGSSAKR